MALQRVSVHSLEEAEALPGDPRTAVISVTDPEVEARLDPRFGALLRLAFHDVEEGYLIGASWPEWVRPFEETQAQELIAWAAALAQEAIPYHVAVHCHAGISRSSAIAWFLHQRHGAELNWLPHFYPNRRVLRLLGENGGPHGMPWPGL